MLRLTQNLVRYGYNGGAYYRRGIQSMPWETEKKELKKEFKEGEKPEFIYDEKVKFDEDYKPYKIHTNSSVLIGFVLLCWYFTYRFEHMRKKEGRTLRHEYSI